MPTLIQNTFMAEKVIDEVCNPFLELAKRTEEQRKYQNNTLRPFSYILGLKGYKGEPFYNPLVFTDTIVIDYDRYALSNFFCKQNYAYGRPCRNYFPVYGTIKHYERDSKILCVKLYKDEVVDFFTEYIKRNPLLDATMMFYEELFNEDHRLPYLFGTPEAMAEMLTGNASKERTMEFCIKVLNESYIFSKGGKTDYYDSYRVNLS